MAKLSDIGVPGTGRGILMPPRLSPHQLMTELFFYSLDVHPQKKYYNYSDRDWALRQEAHEEYARAHPVEVWNAAYIVLFHREPVLKDNWHQFSEWAFTRFNLTTEQLQHE